MRASVCAVCPSAGLLMPGAAAIADPPWERGHQYEARGCKYEYKSGPHGFKEEYACDGGGRQYAAGTPGLAPAHGWRRKHAQHHEAGRVVADLGIELGRCNRDVIGSQIGKRSERTAATLGGTIVGVLIGGAIGRSMDEADQACVAQTLEQAPARHAVAWSNPDGGHYHVVPLEGTRTARGASAATTAPPRLLRGASSSSMVPPAGSRTGAGSGRVDPTCTGHPEPDDVLRCVRR